MRRRSAFHSEVSRRRYEPATEMVLPKPIHHHAGRDGESLAGRLLPRLLPHAGGQCHRTAGRA